MDHVGLTHQRQAGPLRDALKRQLAEVREERDYLRWAQVLAVSKIPAPAPLLAESVDD